LAHALTQGLAARLAPRLGMDRRAFLASSSGMAATLAVVNHLEACAKSHPGGALDGPLSDAEAAETVGRAEAAIDVDDVLDAVGRGRGPEEAGYDITPEMLCDEDAARARLSGDELVFDVQTHHVNTAADAPWLTKNFGFKFFFDYLGSKWPDCSEKDFRCFSQKAYIDEIFVKSDTSVAILTGVPALEESNPLTNPELTETRDLVNLLAASQRLLTHAMVLPDQGETALAGMAAMVETLKPAAWKVYTPWTPKGGGWWLDDPAVGLPFLEQAKALGVGIVCAHKGLPLPGFSSEHSHPKDIGPAAKLHPELDIVVYHSGYDSAAVEGPFDTNGQGVDRLVKSLQGSGIGPGQNVWAELGGTWFQLLSKPTEAAHVLGKLLLAVGPDRILWGTDCIWFGSPQPLIQAFRAFEIPEQLQAEHGYPALSAEVKAKILGLNACSLYAVDPVAVRCTIREDWVSRLKTARLDLPFGPPGPLVYGPTTRRAFFESLRRRFAG
jgi:predicted TIM-barrel fold metal-dependent hydrolase